jgi:hypothetical protein
MAAQPWTWLRTEGRRAVRSQAKSIHYTVSRYVATLRRTSVGAPAICWKQRTHMSLLLGGLFYETPQVIFLQNWGIFCDTFVGEFCGQTERERIFLRPPEKQIAALWAVTVCSFLERYWRFGENCRLHLPILQLSSTLKMEEYNKHLVRIQQTALYII